MDLFDIMNNAENVTGKNTVATAVIDVYKKYVQIKTKKVINSDTIKILTPKEVVYEGGRVLELIRENTPARFYVYGPYGVNSVYNEPGTAVAEAYDLAGWVTNENGICVKCDDYQYSSGFTECLSTKDNKETYTPNAEFTGILF